jgi:hypothetical protein
VVERTYEPLLTLTEEIQAGGDREENCAECGCRGPGHYGIFSVPRNIYVPFSGLLKVA